MPSNYNYNISYQPPASTDDDKAGKFLEKLSPDEIRALDARARMTDADVARQKEWREVADRFVAEHDEYIQCDENVAAMAVYLAGRGIGRNMGTGTRADLEEAYDFLKSNNALKLDQNKLRRKLAKQIEAEKAAEPTEEELYSMPTDELRRWANGRR